VTEQLGAISRQLSVSAGLYQYKSLGMLKADSVFPMRIFIALDIDDAIRQRIQRFMEGVSGFAPDARWVRPESLHVTLKFIGEKPDEAVEEIKHALAGIRAKPIEITFRGYGFFPTPKAARVFWVGIESGTALPSLANTVDETTAVLGIAKEEHPFTAHLTLARGGGRSGSPRLGPHDTANKNFQRVQEKLAALPTPEFGTMTAHEFFLYQSQISRGGSRYTKIASFTLE
jgi:RNA 2',3'-cyclic 3'-phosphodiesterase